MISFQKFSTYEEGIALKQLLEANSISCELNSISKKIDPVLFGVNSDMKYELLIPASMFEKANKIVDEENKIEIEKVNKNYFLFDFSDDELKDVVRKVDEWGSYNKQLAIKILADRGIVISETEQNNLNQNRINELIQPDKVSKWVIVVGYIFSFLGALIGFTIGMTLFYSKKTLPNGQKIYTYSKPTRHHGLNMMLIAGVLFIIGLIKLSGYFLTYSISKF